jgi:uncharacterized membrane protein YccC
MDKKPRDQLVGGFGGSGGGLILLAFFMYLIASPTTPSIFEPSVFIGTMGAVLLLMAIIIRLRNRVPRLK